MSVYVITGKLGSGKGLQAARVIQDFLKRGRYVATNMDIFPEHLLPAWNNNNRLQRLPDYPTADDLNNIGFKHFNDSKNRFEGRGTNSKNYKFFGALVLDEMSVWMNSHNWNDPKIAEVRSWIANARKLGWHVYFITQNSDQMDRQTRESFIEFELNCKALELSFIPFVGSFLNAFFSKKSSEDDENTNDYRLHFSILKFGLNEYATKLKRTFIFDPKSLYLSYDTNQVYLKSNPDSVGLHSVLSPYLIKGRYLSFMEMYKKLIFGSLALGLTLGSIFSYVYLSNQHNKELLDQKNDSTLLSKKSNFDEKIKILGSFQIGKSTHLTINRDGSVQTIEPSNFKQTSKGFCVYEKDVTFGNACDSV